MSKKFRRKPRRSLAGSIEQIIDDAVEKAHILKINKGTIKTALVYPNTYQAGMSNLGFHVVLKVANQIENVSCERVFWSKPDKTDTIPKSVETGLALDRFDVILFSISFENDFTHLVQLLGQAGLPLRSSDRNHIHPLMAAGGVACYLNPEPIAPFMDCFLMGAAESLLPSFFAHLFQAPDRFNFLKTLSQNVPGTYVPVYPPKGQSKVRVQSLKTLESFASHTAILTQETAFKNAFLIETLKGCPHGCRFCTAGFIYRPPRSYPKENIMAAMEKAVGKTDKIGLVSSAIADHPDILDICRYGLKNNFKLSFSSLRLDKLSSDLLSILTDSKMKTATLAPEAGSERMRRIINKNVTEKQILLAAANLVEAGIINLKLYFMIGLPFETMDDIHGIVQLTKRIKKVFLDASRKKKKIGRITLSINPFIPKPVTPFQWAAMEKETILKQKISLIRQELKRTANLTIQVESLKKAKIYTLLSMGDAGVADVIISAAKNGWPSALKEHGRLCEKFISEQKQTDTPLPWDFIDTGIHKSFLADEYSKAKNEKRSAPCPMIDCQKCRICRS